MSKAAVIERFGERFGALLREFDALEGSANAFMAEALDATKRSFVAEDFYGDGEVVVIIDTGWNKQFLAEDEYPIDEFDFYNSDDSALVSNATDHGSWVDEVVRGVAEDAQTVHLQVFSDGGRYASAYDIEDALQWTIDNAEWLNVVAVNMSLGVSNATEPTQTLLSNEIATLEEMGVATVISAGNSGQYGVQLLAADPSAVAVSASGSNNSPAYFTQQHEDLTDIFAFGYRVPVTDVSGVSYLVSGTSFSAPYVSGAIARLQDAADEVLGRRLQTSELVEILQASGEELLGASSKPAGYRVANADAAVTYLINNADDYLVSA